MSMINEELQKQQDADIGAAIKKVLGAQTAVINAGEERKRIAAEQKLAEIAELRVHGWDY